jgi:predicted negative regulator of RcsB-dependent stress response
LKSDKFALEVGNTVTFFEEHQQLIVRYGIAGVVAAALIFGYVIYSRHQRAAREEALTQAIQVQEASVGGVSGNGSLVFPTQEAKDQESTRVFSRIASQWPGTAEGEIARYYLGSILSDEGKLAESEKDFQEAAQKGDADYASLAKLSLAQIYLADGRTAQAESTLRDLIAHPTVFVSRDQASIALARFFIDTGKPAEARKLLDPLRNTPGAVGQVAVQIYGELPPQ